MIKKRYKQPARIFAILFIIFFGYIIFSADKGTLLPFIRRLYAFPYGDKVGHLLLLALLTLALNFIISKKIVIFGGTLFIGSLTVFGFISAEEVSQIIFSSRTFDLLDLLFSCIGIVTGDGTFRFISGRMRVAASPEAE